MRRSFGVDVCCTEVCMYPGNVSVYSTYVCMDSSNVEMGQPTSPFVRMARGAVGMTCCSIGMGGANDRFSISANTHSSSSVSNVRIQPLHTNALWLSPKLKLQRKPCRARRAA
jgi:hypothetical protein